MTAVEQPDWTTKTTIIVLTQCAVVVMAVSWWLSSIGGVVGRLIDGVAYLALLGLVVNRLCVRPGKPLAALIPRGDRSAGGLLGFTVLTFVATTVAAALAMYGSEWIWLQVLGRPSAESVPQPLTGSLAERGLHLTTTIVLAPVLEEIVSRGMLYRWLRRRRGDLTALLGSSVFFAALHFNAEDFLTHAAWGLAAAYFVGRSRSLYPAIAAHVSQNALAFIL